MAMETSWMEGVVVKKKVSLETRMFLEFFESQGVTFVDIESGEEIEPILNNDKGEQ